MPKKTYVIIDTEGHFYRSHCAAFFATSPYPLLVTHTADLGNARRFRSLRWATHRAKVLSTNTNRYYYVHEVIGEGAERKMPIRNEQAVEMIRKNDSATMEEVERIIDRWKMKHGLY